MKKVTLDKNYNPIKNPNISVYKDHLFDTAEEINKALNAGIITKEVADFLLQILVNKEVKKDSAELIQWISQEDRKENASIFINVSNNNKRYA